MIHIDLFSGIGGFALAAKMAGYEFSKSYHSDVEENANKIYSKNFPDSEQLGDITKIDGKKIREENPDEKIIITGGFPCQDISTAGNRVGISGSRSSLWWEYHRLIDELQPTFCIIENVSALRRGGLERVLLSLTTIGYDCEWQTISAADVGAPHLRERVWIVSYPSKIRNTHLHGCRIQAGEQQEKVQHLGAGRKSNGLHDWPTPWTHWIGAAGENGKLHTNAAICRVDHGLSEKLDGVQLKEVQARIKGLGNAIVPQVAAYVFERAKVLLN